MNSNLYKSLTDFISHENIQYSQQNYSEYHAERFSYVVEQCKKYKSSSDAKVLDIGQSELTARLRKHYTDVTILGLDPISEKRHGSVGHLEKVDVVEKHSANQNIIFYDLNQAREAVSIDTVQKFDLIVFAEVIEHLIAMPEMVLLALSEILNDDGVIVCQTPNAAALHKRILAFLGHNPYERIRANFSSPGHFREYTKAELIQIGKASGLSIEKHNYIDYFAAGSGLRGFSIRLLKFLSFFKKSFSRGQTIIYRKVIEK